MDKFILLLGQKMYKKIMGLLLCGVLLLNNGLLSWQYAFGEDLNAGSTATLVKGSEFNNTLSNLAGGREKIKSIERSKELPKIEGCTVETLDKCGSIISDNDSEIKVVAWYDGETSTIYYYTEASKIYLNEDSSYMFYEMNSLESIDMSGWDTSKVTNMYEMFYDCKNLTELDLSKFDTSNVTVMKLMFYECNSLTELDLSKFNTSKVTNMNEMFNGCSSLTELDLSKFDTSNVTEMYKMFSNMGKLTTIYTSEKFTIGKETKTYEMFIDTKEIKGGAGTTYDANHTDGEYARIDGGKENPGYFTAKGGGQNGGTTATLISGKEFNNTLVSLTEGRENIKSIERSKDLPNVEGCTVDTLDKCGSIISDKESEKEVIARYDEDSQTIYWYTQADKIYMNQDSSYMFAGCRSLTELDLSKFNTSKVTNMKEMFAGCRSLTELDLSKFDTSNVTNMEYMFAECSSLTKLDLSNWDTSKVTNMYEMFGKGCNSLTELDLSKFDTSNVINMEYMFSDMGNLTTIYTSEKFTIGKETKTNKMFIDTKGIKGGAGTKYDANHTDGEYARIDGLDGKPGYFTVKGEKKYKVNMYNEGSLYETQFVPENGKLKKPTDPEKKYATFVGWYQDKNFEGDQFDFDTEITSSFDLYANFKLDHDVNNNGIADEEEKFMIAWHDDGKVLKIDYLEYLSMPSFDGELNKVGYTFVGWTPAVAPVINDVIYTATWQKQGGSSSGGGGGSSSSSNGSQSHGSAKDDTTGIDLETDKTIGIYTGDSDLGNDGDQELIAAYNWAYEKGIIDMNSIINSDTDGYMTRIEMAEFLSKFAINVLGKTPDQNRHPKFADVSQKENEMYSNGVTLAYQLGIMGINMPNDEFRPNDIVTRAEFVTALSRLLYNTPDGMDVYYSTHMKLLNKSGVIKVTNPTMKEIRGYVMIMLMRSEGI